MLFSILSDKSVNKEDITEILNWYGDLVSKDIFFPQM